MEGINPFLLKTESKLSDNYDDEKRCPESSGIENAKSSLTEFNGLMELDISQATDRSPLHHFGKIVESITELSNEESSRHVNFSKMTLGEETNSYQPTDKNSARSFKRSSLGSLMHLQNIGEGTGPNSS